MALKIALAGNPNCGKTTLFNALTGAICTCFSSRRAFRRGRNASTIFSWITRDSHALHTPIRCVFALKIMSIAISKSALSSTKIWQLPVPVSITGIRLFSTTLRISPAPPLGISTSTYCIFWNIHLCQCCPDDLRNRTVGQERIAASP